MLPVGINIPPGSICIELVDVSGSILFCPGGCGPAGPDGTSFATFTLDSVDGISGFTATRARALHGVFLADAEPANPAPTPLTFTDFSFTQLAPQIAQQFYIGDGLTGTGTGSPQRFIVPPGATRLFLGFADGLGPCIGWYGDNGGSASGTVLISGIVQQPRSQTACLGGSAAFSITTQADSTNLPISYRWRKNGVLISPLINQSAATPTLHLFGVVATDAAAYDCIISNSCGSAVSAAATLTITACACSLADIAGGGPTGQSPDGIVDGSDFVAFINSFSTGDGAIDPLAYVAGGGADGLAPDGVIDGSDFIAFINAFAAGC